MKAYSEGDRIADAQSQFGIGANTADTSLKPHGDKLEIERTGIGGATRLQFHAGPDTGVAGEMLPVNPDASQARGYEKIICPERNALRQ